MFRLLWEVWQAFKKQPSSASLMRAASLSYDDRTREQKLLTAPYALGWDEGYDAAYKSWKTHGFVPHISYRTSTHRK